MSNTMDSSNAFVIQNLSKRFPNFTLENLNLTLPAGCILGLVGENGAGKSTTIRLLMNAITRDAGEVFVLGMDNRDPAFCALKEEIGVVLDEAHFPECLTAKQLGQVMKKSYTRWDAGVYADYLQRFSLPTDKRFKDFSRGMKMKLAIAVALSHAPRLLILDEATSGLDPIVRDEVLDIFSEFTRDEGHSILLSSHILSDLEKLCDYIAFLHRGKLLFCEEKDRLLETYAVYSSSREALDRLPEGALCRAEIGGYHCRSLVLREKMPAGLALEPASVEDIVLFLGKENKR